MNVYHHLKTALFLGSGAAGFVLAGVAVLLFWWSPASPLSRDEPAIKVSEGDIRGAADAYLVQSTGWGSDSEREEAMWRAALLEAVELGASRKAIQLLEEFQRTWPASDHRADGVALLAELYVENPKLQRKAAQTWEYAARIAPDHPHAGDWLVRGAETWTGLGKIARAEATWRLVSRYPEHEVAAWMAIAGARLPDSPERAYEAFRQVLKRNPYPGDAALARLGMATSLERMERYLEAEETIDLALAEDLDNPTLTQRKRRLEAIQ
jgi:tetratricopeptide (TPR) repeat protein